MHPFRLRKSSASIKFVTNTTKESKRILHDRLTKLGFDIKKDEIFSSLAAAREVVKNRKLNPLFLIDNAAMEDFEDLVDSNSSPNAVLVGLAPDKFEYSHLNEAFRYDILNSITTMHIRLPEVTGLNFYYFHFFVDLL